MAAYPLARSTQQVLQVFFLAQAREALQQIYGVHVFGSCWAVTASRYLLVLVVYECVREGRGKGTLIASLPLRKGTGRERHS